jgi:hypothetical protein
LRCVVREPELAAAEDKDERKPRVYTAQFNNGPDYLTSQHGAHALL